MNTETSAPNADYPIWGLSGTLIWGFLIWAAIVVLTLILAILYTVWFLGPGWDTFWFFALLDTIHHRGDFVSIATLVTSYAGVLLLLAVIKLKKNSNLKHYLALRVVDFRTIRNWFLVFVCLLVAINLFALLLGRPLPLVPEHLFGAYDSENRDPEWTYLLWPVMILAAPLFEELFFRGFLITGLSSTVVGAVGAIVISAALWATLHCGYLTISPNPYDVYNIVTIFIMGIVLGISRLKSGSSLLPIGLHSFAILVVSIQICFVEDVNCL